MLALAQTFCKTGSRTPAGESVRLSYATAQRYGIGHQAGLIWQTNATHRMCNMPSVFAWMSSTLNGSCPSGNKLAKIRSRTSLGAKVLSCWFSCDGERSAVMAAMTLTREMLLSGALVGGVGAGVCVCVCVCVGGCTCDCVDACDCTGDGSCCTSDSGCGVGCSGGVGRFG